jgi:hypothetical protein
MPQSILKADTEAEKSCLVQSYLRRPDAAFWLDLLAPPPQAYSNRPYAPRPSYSLLLRGGSTD